MDTHGIDGMRHAGVAHCDKCKHETWVLDGTTEALTLFRAFLDQEHGAEAIKTGTADRPDRSGPANS